VRFSLDLELQSEVAVLDVEPTTGEVGPAPSGMV
jgi:hypothetical protein